jgi:hypothetical protein
VATPIGGHRTLPSGAAGHGWLGQARIVMRDTRSPLTSKLK